MAGKGTARRQPAAVPRRRVTRIALPWQDGPPKEEIDMQQETTLNAFAKPARDANSDYALRRYRRALLAHEDTPKGILTVPHRDPARDRAMRAVFGPQPER